MDVDSDKDEHNAAKQGAGSEHLSRRSALIKLGLTGLALTMGGTAWASCSDPTPVSTPVIDEPYGTAVYVIYRGHTEVVNALAWSPNGKRIVSVSDDQTVQIWDATTGKNVLAYHDNRNGIYSILTVAWSPDGSRIVFGDRGGGTQGAALILNANNARPTYTYAAPSNEGVFSLAWSPDGSRIASDGEEGDHAVIRVWDARTGKTLQTYHGHNSIATSMAWSPDSRRIASGDDGNQVHVWDVKSGNQLLVYTGHKGEHGVHSVTWSPDGRQVVSGSDDNTARVWDAATGKTHLIYSKHSSSVWGLSWSPDGKRIASAGAYPDATVQLWDAQTGDNVFVYRGHSHDYAVSCVEWSPNGKMIASGSNDHTIHVWQAK